MNIKLVTGFKDFSIDAEEAHKAYYLFLHPNERGTFSNGLAIRGQDIQRIEPDYQGTMGWNPTHRLDEDDWNQIKKYKVDKKLRDLMYEAKQLAQSPTIDKLLGSKMTELSKNLLS